MNEHGPDPRTAAHTLVAERQAAAAWLAQWLTGRPLVEQWAGPLIEDLQAVAAGRSPILSREGHAPLIELVEVYRRALDWLVATAMAYRAEAVDDWSLLWVACIVAVERAKPCPPVPMLEAAKANTEIGG